MDVIITGGLWDELEAGRANGNLFCQRVVYEMSSDSVILANVLIYLKYLLGITCFQDLDQNN